MTKDHLVVVFNGEIYNFLEIKAHPDLNDYSFKTNSDTEVILAGYLVWGLEALLEKINGMFALAIYDQQLNKIILARDRFGKKPLYYYYDNHRFIFSSDIRSIVAVTSPTLNHNVIDYYLYELASPQPYSIWNEIRQVPPASILCFEVEAFNFKITSYWKIGATEQITDENEALAKIEESIINAILRRTISDVSLGCFLSGGIDSGLIVSMLASNSKDQIDTYSVGIEGIIDDELSAAKLVADKYDTNHHEIIMSVDLLGDNLEHIIKYVGEPFADPSIIPSYYISKEIKKYATVALSGDGGDELFGGYSQYYQAFRTEEFLSAYSSDTFRKLAIYSDKILSRLSGRENLGSYDYFSSLAPSEKLFRNMGFPERLRKELWSDTDVEWSKKYLVDRWDDYHTEGLTNQLMLTSIHTRLLNDYLVKVDRSSMQNSLEIRSPFLDVELAELAFKISPQLKFKNNRSKYILRKLAEKYMGSHALHQPKRGFDIPISSWMRGQLKSNVEDRLQNLKSRNLFNNKVISNLWNLHLKGVSDEGYRLWILFCLEIWFEEFLPDYKR